MSENNNRSYTIRELAEEDRPREKFMLKGRHTLSNAELIAILISSGSENETAIELSQKILHSCHNDLNELGKLNVSELRRLKGIGPAKAITILAALELGRRRQAFESEKKSQISCSRDIYEIVQPIIGDLLHEEFWVLYLNRGNRLLEKERISAGGISGTVVDVRIIMKNALQKLASSIVLIHNHPSGNLTPSDADIALTRKLKEAGKLLEILVLDHLIIGEKGYYSFADEGML